MKYRPGRNRVQFLFQNLVLSLVIRNEDIAELRSQDAQQSAEHKDCEILLARFDAIEPALGYLSFFYDFQRSQARFVTRFTNPPPDRLEKFVPLIVG